MNVGETDRAPAAAWLDVSPASMGQFLLALQPKPRDALARTIEARMRDRRAASGSCSPSRTTRTARQEGCRHPPHSSTITQH
jgi:hypothetical protein